MKWKHRITERVELSADQPKSRYYLDSRPLRNGDGQTIVIGQFVPPEDHAVCEFDSRDGLEAAKRKIAALIGHVPNVDFSSPPENDVLDMTGARTWVAFREVEDVAP